MDNKYPINFVKITKKVRNFYPQKNLRKFIFKNYSLKVIQVIIYIGAIVSILYFYGVVQAVLKRMAWLMQLTMGTTATESLNACACVLLGNVYF